MALRRSLITVLILSLFTGSFVFTPPPAEAQELSPIFVYTGDNAFERSYTKFGQAAGRLVEEHETFPSDLSGYGCVIISTNRVAFSQSQLDLFSDYVNAGGRLFAVGENGFYSDENAHMNAVASHLGSGLAIVDDFHDRGPTSNIEPSLLTAGVHSIQVVSTSGLTVSGAGQVLVRTVDEDSAVPFIGAAQIGAGLFVLSGDSNVFSDDDHDGYSLYDNGQLVFNLCSAPLPEPILVYTGNDALNGGFSTFGQAAGREVVEQETLPADLSGYGCVILPLNDTPFSQDQLDQFVAYVQGGGRLFALGDWANESHGFGSRNANMNAVATALGSGMTIINEEIDDDSELTSNIESSFYTAGVNSIGYSLASPIAATGNGQVLVRTPEESGVPFIGAELIGDGLFVLTGESNAFSDVAGAYQGADNDRLVFNLCSGPLNQPPTVTISGVTEGAAYEHGSVLTATCLVGDNEDGPSSFPATLSEITGPQASLGLGSQTASCSYTDTGGETASASVTYSIIDSTGPVLALPDLIVPATSPTGATVTWIATAEDAVEGSIEATCIPASGSFFSIPDPLSDATSTVECSATDSSGNTSSDDFTMTVLGALSQLRALRVEVQESSIHPYAIRGLDRALASAENGLNRNHLPTTCFQLSFFQTQVNLYRMMGQVPSGQSAEWLADAARIKTVLGC